jgi:hypothetical protein
MGPSITVYARGPLTDSKLNEIANRLAELTLPQLQLTRGCEWSLWSFEGPVSNNAERPCWIRERPIFLHLRRTEDVLWDCEDELLDLGLLPKEVPSHFYLYAGCNSPDDYDLLRELGMVLANLVDGIATEPLK